MNYGPQVPECDAQHAQKYRGPGESFEEACNRQASALTSSQDEYKAFREILLEMRFMPGGRIQSAVGSTRNVTPYNCFVSGTISDSLREGDGSIMKRMDEAMGTLQMGGGIGYDFSTLRPRGFTIKKLQTHSAGPIPFMTMFDAGCGCISAAGHRRGAQMGVMRVDHPDIEEFVYAKQKSGMLENFNISVAVTDEFMRAVEAEDDSFWLQFEGRNVRQIKARALWETIMRSTWDWAEPGVVFIDRINAQNNLWYCEQIAATNPCLAEGTLVSTSRGFVPVERVGVGEGIAVIGGRIRPVGSIERHNGVPVYRVSLSDGTELRATEAHIFHVAEGKWFNRDRTLGSLDVGDKVRLSPSAMPSRPDFRGDEFPTVSDRDYGLIVGAVIGDGCYTEKSKQTKIACSVNEQEWGNVLLDKIPGSHKNRSTDSCFVIASTELSRQLDRCPLSRGYSHEKKLPLDLLNSNQEFLTGFLDGLSSTGGNIHLSKSNPMIRIASTSKESLLMAKRALSCFGILARVYPEKKKHAGASTVIDGREVINRNQGYVLVILGEGLRRFYEKIRLSHPQKQNRMETLVAEYSLTGCTWTATIQSIEPDGVADVYDLYEPETDTWITDGVVNRGCGEQPLPPNGACLLGSFNLTKYLYWDHPMGPSMDGNWEFDYDQLAADIPHVVAAMDRVIDVATYPLYEQEQEAKSKRRMGLGITGVANAIEALGFPYGSEGFLNRLEVIMTTIRDAAYRASIELAKERGPFPMYNEQYLGGEFIQTLPEYIQQGIQAHGIRNSHLLSIAPTGTISLCADNISSGIEPVFAYDVDRQIIGPDNVARTFTFEDYGKSVLGVRGKVSSEVTADEHLGVLATAQGLVDSAVSKTCNVDGSMPWDDFKNIYMEAWRRGCKGCTTFNKDGKRMAILEERDETPSSCRIDTETGRRECE